MSKLNLAEYLWHLAWMTDNLSNKRVRSGDDWINLETDTNESSRNGVHEMVVVCLEGSDLRLNFSPLNGSSSLVLCDETWSDGDFVTNFENTSENCSTGNSSFEGFGILSWLVDVERSDNDHLWRCHKISHWNWNSAKIIDNSFNVVSKLGRDWNDWCIMSNCPIYKLSNIILLFDTSSWIFDSDINLIL